MKVRVKDVIYLTVDVIITIWLLYDAIRLNNMTAYLMVGVYAFVILPLPLKSIFGKR